jgi:hypothetical protein
MVLLFLGLERSELDFGGDPVEVFGDIVDPVPVGDEGFKEW